MHHVLSDGVEVLESAVNVTGSFVKIQGIVQDDFITEKYLIIRRIITLVLNGLIIPLSVEFVSFTFIDLSELLLKVRSQMDRGVEILPYQRVMFYISANIMVKTFIFISPNNV